MAVADGLALVAQDDWAGGAFQSVARHLIAPNGAWEITNGLLDDDGQIYRRGGSEYQSNAGFGTAIRWVWDGFFAAGARTVMASPTAFGVLDTNDASPISLGGAGLTEPKASVLVGGILFIGGGTMYAGSRKTADYSTGTVSVTHGSKTVTGAGTTWTTNVDAGMLFRLGGSGRYYVVASVDSNTQVTLSEAYEGVTAAAQTYALTRLGSAVNHGAPAAEVYATAGDRLVACVGGKVLFSEGPNPGSSDALLVGNYRTHSWPATNVHELAYGEQVVAAAGLGDRLLVFSTGGMWVISNMALNTIDAAGNSQHREQKVSNDLVAWGPCGVAAWENALVVAATDGVWMVDGISRPRLLTRSIRARFSALVRTGAKPGLPAVFKSHLFLPVLDSGSAFADLLVCRLDRAVGTREGEALPWTFMAGHGAKVTSLARRVSSTTPRTPQLLGGGTDGRVLRLTKFFDPDGTVKADADATVHDLTVETRSYATAQGVRNRNTVRLARIHYELEDAAADNPRVLGSYSTGGKDVAGVGVWGQNWGQFNWAGPDQSAFQALSGTAGAQDGRTPYTWLMAAHAEYVRFRFKSSGAAARLVLRSLELSILPSGRAF